jgi:hypothetical protein
MPYSGPKDTSLPDHVKKMSNHDKEQWVEVFNSALKQHPGDEAKAFTMANGVVKKKKKDLISTFYSIDKRQLYQDAAKYEAMGGSTGKGCGNCHWFVPEDDGCILVSGDIMPTGVCSMWMAEPEQVITPIPVTIVKGGIKQFALSLKDAALALLGTNENDSAGDSDKAPETVDTNNESHGPEAPVQAKSFILYKTDDGLRFFTVYSNYFKDKQQEVIKGEAHQEYVDYATKTGNYPDLWLWHSGPKSKWGKVDWLDYCDGFVVASGLIDKDKESLAEDISKEALGVSHGFYGLMNGNTIWRYRSFEISPLPAVNAANDFTDINFLFKECEMPFTDAKKAWLKDTAKLPETVIKEWEDSLAGLNTQLKALGLDWKEAEEKSEVDVVSEVVALTKAVSLMADSMVTIAKKQVDIEKDMDTKVADVFTSQAAKLKDGYKATEDPKNVVGEVKNKDAADFFGDLVLAPLYKR